MTVLRWLFILFFWLPTAALAGQIDYFFSFPTEAAAIASAAGTTYYIPAANGNSASWNLYRVAPGLQVWRPSQDVQGTDGQGNPIVTHTFLPGWYGCISLNHIDPTLVNHPNLKLAIDRDLAAAGQPAIIKNNLGVLLNDIMFSPVFAGSNYPFGNLQ
jgi:hypothetical protein